MGPEVFFGAGALVLGAIMAFAMFRNRKQNRNPHNDRVGQDATRESYRKPDSYNPDKFRARLTDNPDGTEPNKS